MNSFIFKEDESVASVLTACDCFLMVFSMGIL